MTTWDTVLTVMATLLALGALVAAVLAMELWRERRRRRRAAEPAVAMAPAVERPLDQDDYAEILARDGTRIVRDYTWDRAASTWFCGRCARRATLVGIHHPIWDGPFEGAGSGVVDRRDVPWCPPCDRVPDLGGLAFGAAVNHLSAQEGIASGRPVRLPWLDQLPVRLRAELFERAAFHRLPVQVERFRPPPAGDAAAEPPAGIPALEAGGLSVLGIGPHEYREAYRSPVAGEACVLCDLPRAHPIHGPSKNLGPGGPGG